jgi:tripartite-type tricarboxylate transporter receptor subunit TctC
MKKASMFRDLHLALLVGSACAGLAVAEAAEGDASFAGKVITATVGFEAGNRVDLYARTLGRRMERYLAGQPNFIVMNRPGAGGVIALNEWVTKADPSGLNIAIGGESQIDEDALSRTHAKYQPEKFRFVGGLVAPSQGLFIDKEAVARLYNKSAPPVTMGLVGSTLRTGYYQVLWGAAFLGWNVKWVPGYQSTGEVRNALERGEIDMSAFGTTTDINDLLVTGKVAVVSQSGAIIDGKMTSRRIFGDAPVISDLVKGKIKDPLAQKAFDYSERVIQVGMWTALPPTTPDGIVATYVKAFEKTIKDPQYKSDWAKIDPDSPVAHKADLEKQVNEVAAVSPEALDFIQAELRRQGVEVSSR